jgi:hypothetical protein
VTARSSGDHAVAPCDELLVWNGVVERVPAGVVSSTSLVELAAAVAAARVQELAPDVVYDDMRAPHDRCGRERGA